MFVLYLIMEHEELEAILLALKEAKKNGLVLEVILSAINEVRGNPKITTADAFVNALYEWDI